jgi:hypothetical protein
VAAEDAPAEPAVTVQDPQPDGAETDELHSHTHVQHCHISPSTCSDQPVPSGPGQMLFAEPLLPALSLHFVLIDEASVTPSVLAIDTLTPPPRA